MGLTLQVFVRRGDIRSQLFSRNQPLDYGHTIESPFGPPQKSSYLDDVSGTLEWQAKWGTSKFMFKVINPSVPRGLIDTEIEINSHFRRSNRRCWFSASIRSASDTGETSWQTPNPSSPIRSTGC
jgi:hypothetical protein